VAPSTPAGANTRTRVVSALVLAPVAFGAAWFGGWAFAAFWILAAIAVLYEWSKIVLGAADLGGASRAAWLVGGAAYAFLMGGSPIVLRNDPQFGFAVIVLLFAVVWTTDILGYFGGRAFGGPKLAPSISPSKTWSGAVAGTLGAAVASAAVAAACGVRLMPVVFVGIVLSLVSQIGDLAESAFKRKFHTKDSSNLIPGHGGVMDRLDGFWAAALVAAMIGIARAGLAEPARGLLVW
jgi:phosphatidate cytidylyltransferase